MKLNIALIDLNHMTIGVHTNTTPLGIGAIARYAKTRHGDDVDIRLFKDHKKLCNALKTWRPDVLGMAQYSWNSELNLSMARTIKEANKYCVVVAGGPDLYLTPEEKADYLRNNQSIDICASHDGEIPFSTIVSRLISGDKVEGLRKDPVDGTYAIDPGSGRLTEGPGRPPRLKSLDEFGAMFADGWFDELLDDGFHPFLQTHRGCPFKCIYCHTADDYCSHMIFQPPEIFGKDMEHLGKRYAGMHNITLYMANTNFGLFKEDFEIARIIRKTQEKYDWPKNIIVNSGKDPDRLLELMSILKYKFIPYISLQTLTPVVLENIRRRNIPFKDFVRFQKVVNSTVSANTTTELILSLPGETKESFTETMTTVLDSGVQNIVIYTLMSLRGTLLSTPDFKKRYGHVIKYRIIPRCFSEIDGKRVFETEEVVVGTDAMRFADYLDLRGLALISTVFASSAEMYPIRKFIAEHGLKVSGWIFGVQERISRYPGLGKLYRSFLDETRKELFDSREALVEFMSREENYRKLVEGKYGDNLLRKYKMVIIAANYSEFLDAGLSVLKEIYLGKGPSDEESDKLFSDIDIFMRSRDVGRVFKDGYGEKYPQNIILRYDIPGWTSGVGDGVKLKSLKGNYSYKLDVSEYSRNRLKSFKEFKRDPELSLQILYRDGYIKDFWPEWVRK